MTPMEELTKTQIVLLTLLVSFVTSIATGIVTVTLMDQAPSDVTRTIDRIIEKTVETVVPGETKIVERVKDNSPSENELVINAVAKSGPALVAITGEGIEARGGFITNKQGLVLTSASGLSSDTKYNIKLISDTSTSTSYQVELSKVDKATGLAFLAPVIKEGTKPSTAKNFLASLTGDADKFAYLELGSGSLSLGERVIALGISSKLVPVVELGNVSSLIPPSDSAVSIIETTIASNKQLLGMPLLDLGGVVVGVYGSSNLGELVIYPDDILVGYVLGASVVATTTIDVN